MASLVAFLSHSIEVDVVVVVVGGVVGVGVVVITLLSSVR
jgi:hypothetical protein